MARALGPPPDLAGYDFVRPLGAGGFADVFLYRERRPERLVAIKVVALDRVAGLGPAMFAVEIDSLAELSMHPAIVTCLNAGTTPRGRPYLVMEYCPGPHLGRGYRTTWRSVAEVLDVGVRIAGALATVHAAGLVHRDVKPHNILVTACGRPVLSDFGVAGRAEELGEVSGYSLPWASPEALADRGTPSAASDVFSLGATLFTLLERHSPFEGARGLTDRAALRAAIRAGRPAEIRRIDVPPLVRRALARAMARDPAERFGSARRFGEELRAAQRSLGLPLAPLDAPGETLASVGVRERGRGRAFRARRRAVERPVSALLGR